MPAPLTRADALREYLTGAASDGSTQPDAALSLGHYRSSAEAASLGVVVSNPLSGVTIEFVGGANAEGTGTLTASDTATLTWLPPGNDTAGAGVAFSGAADEEIVEGLDPGAYLRISGTTPFTPGSSELTLTAIPNNVFGMSNVPTAEATTGLSEYRATIVRNEAASSVTAFKRWLGTLGSTEISNAGFLASSGAGTIITTGSFADWPLLGWCRVQTSGGTLKEVVYYTSRTTTVLTVPAAGRGRLGTSVVVGTATDRVLPVPGVAIGSDTAGVQSFGAAIQTIANAHTAPAGITWNLGVTEGTGLSLGTLAVNKQIGLWMWRETPTGVLATPKAVVKLMNSFDAP